MKKDEKTKKSKNGVVATENTIQYPKAGTQRKSRKEIRKQKSRNRIITFLLVVLLLAICVFISLKVLFIVRAVQVVGTEKYTDTEIIDFCAVPMEESIFRIDVDTISQRLQDNFTYIESAQVMRKLPNKILVKITDAVPTYCVAEQHDDGETYYGVYSLHFKQLTVQSHKPEGLITVDVDMSNEECAEIFGQLIDILDRNSYTDYTEIFVRSQGEIGIVYDDRITVSLGTMLDMEYKLKMAYHVITQEISDDSTGTMDATVSGKIVYNLLG